MDKIQELKHADPEIVYARNCIEIRFDRNDFLSADLSSTEVVWRQSLCDQSNRFSVYLSSEKKDIMEALIEYVGIVKEAYKPKLARAATVLQKRSVKREIIHCF